MLEENYDDDQHIENKNINSKQNSSYSKYTQETSDQNKDVESQ